MSNIPAFEPTVGIAATRTPSISVALCTYNGAKFLGEQLESIATQSILPKELVICDDESNDCTLDIISKFAARVSFPIRLESNASNIGSTKNFEKAIAKCECEIIALADQDDIWLPHKLERIGQVFAAAPEISGVFSDAELIDQRSNPLGYRLWDTFLFSPSQRREFASGAGINILLKHPVVTGATFAFRESFRALMLPIPSNVVHDYWMSFLLCSCGRLALIDEPLIRYRRHPAQQIGSGPGGGALGQRIAIASYTGARFYLEEIKGLEQICDRLRQRRSEFSVGKETMAGFAAKIAHRRVRAMLPRSRVSRLPSILRELFHGRYTMYSEGCKSAAKDLFL